MRACHACPEMNLRAKKQHRLKPVLSPMFGTLLYSTTILSSCGRGLRERMTRARLDARRKQGGQR
jgi:hypothetical protein